MYVAVKGGERAIANAHALLAKEGRGDLDLPRIDFAAVAGQLGVLVSRIMTEGSLYDPELAARAIVQAQGGALEAITLVRSYRTTLPRFGYTRPVDTAGLPPQRRISATFKHLPGGQQLGATFDYTHRLFTDRDAGSSARWQKALRYQAPEPTSPPKRPRLPVPPETPAPDGKKRHGTGRRCRRCPPKRPRLSVPPRGPGDRPGGRAGAGDAARDRPARRERPHRARPCPGCRGPGAG